jgi:hypothetical protein
MLPAILWFPAQGFIDSDEQREQRINETIGGAALAKWLSGELKTDGPAGRLKIREPWAEDHGWDFEAQIPDVAGATYLIVCTVEDNGSEEACVQVHRGRPRSGRGERLQRADPVVARVVAALEAHGVVIQFE